MIHAAVYIIYFGILLPQQVVGVPQAKPTAQSDTGASSGNPKTAPDGVALHEKSSQRDVPQGESQTALVLWVSRDDGDLLFEFGEEVCNAADITDELKKQMAKRQDQAVVLIFNDSVAFSDYKTVLDLAARVGFHKFASFVRWKKGPEMSEVFLSRRDGDYVEVTGDSPQPIPNKRKKLMQVLARMRPL